MVNRLEFTSQARDDASEAYAWYERRSAGLGANFLRQVAECLDHIQANPELFEVVYKKYRRAIIRRYPYVIFYAFDGDVVTIHSIFQSAQNPRKWRRRLP